MSPRVVHLVAGGLSGGAARGAYWLHQALRRIGLHSTLLTDGPGDTGDISIQTLRHPPPQALMRRVSRRLDEAPSYLYPKRLRRIFSTGTRGLDYANHEAVRNADLVHLHWINGIVSIESLRALDKPLVWTLRDMWPFTGGCHYAMACERYRTGCGACPQLGSRHDNDLSRRVLRRKQTSFPDRLVPVGISEWLSDCARASAVFQGKEIVTIPNGIDTERFAPWPATAARQQLGLPQDRRLVMFGAQQLRDFYKGFDHLLRALTMLDRQGLHLLVVGHADSATLAELPIPHTALGFVTSDERLRLAYAAADVFVAPSVMEAFGKSLAEALACGTPVVCFDATGPRDIVEHLITGYRATAFDAQDLARGIRWVLDLSASEHADLRARGRQRAMAEFDSLAVAKRYESLYREMLSGTRDA